MSAPSQTRINVNTTTPGWRVVNLLAFASPYLVAAALFLALYLTRSPVQQSSESAENTAAPAVSASGPSIPISANSSGASAPPADKPLNSAEPAPQAKHETLPEPTHPPAEKPVLTNETLPNQPVAVDPAIASSMKLSGAAPMYPAVAQAAGVHGTVVVALTIAPDGSVSEAHAISGPALLQATTIAAVRSWRYRPYLIQGKAAPFETQVSFNFTISSSPSQP